MQSLLVTPVACVQGTVHLQMPRLGPICKKLSVDYAPAMTGFDIRGGRSVPVIEGVVVCKEDEATVLEAYIEDERWDTKLCNAVVHMGLQLSQPSINVPCLM